MWAQVALHPDDDGPRLALADALLEIGDPRGELITMQCLHPDPQRERALLDAHWDAWLGPLAPIVARRGSAFVRGMLEIVTLQRSRAALEVARGHRELRVVRVLRSLGVAPPDLVAFAFALERPPRTFEIRTRDVIPLLQLRTRHFPIVELELVESDPRPLVLPAMQLSRIVPDVEQLWLDATPPDLAKVCRLLPSLLPRLQHVWLSARAEAALDDATRAELFAGGLFAPA